MDIELILLSTDVIYDTFDEFYTAITVYTYLNGYEISKLRTKANNKGIYRADFGCVQGKKLVTREYKIRDSLTVKYNYLFAAFSKICDER